MDAFEKHIKNIFENHEAPLDIEELWQKVEPSLNKKPRRRLWPVFLLVSLSVLTGIFLMVDYKQDLTAKSQALVSKDTSFFGRKGQLIHPDSAKPVAYAKNSGATSDAPQNTKNTFKSNSSNPVENIQRSYSSISNTVDENDEAAGSEKAVVIAVSDQNPEITFISTPKVDLSPLVQPVILLNHSFDAPALTPKGQLNPFKFSLDIFGGADYSKKFLIAKSLDDTWYREKRKATEMPLESYQFGGQFSVKHTSGWFAGTGLVYYRTTELFESKDRVLVEKITDDIVEIITHADGTIEEISGSKIILEPKSWEKRKYNAYHFLDVPVFLGYSFPVKRTLMEIYSGISVNIYFKQNGEILGHDGLPFSLDENPGSVFSKTVPVSGIFGINSLIPVNEKWVVFVSPVMHFNLKSITQTAYPLEQKYFKTGVRIGTRLRF
ncbi:MAG TPA: hypothetical protein PLU49_09130 [Saprospiraceae bacterium]|nr:hypothetical protein [Saprospirales bacterium]HRQ30220.1 hypothetical protein [Saprospiraceae bacterium]